MHNGIHIYMHTYNQRGITAVIIQAAIYTYTRTYIQRHILACTHPSSHTQINHIQSHTQRGTYTYTHNPDWMVD